MTSPSMGRVLWLALILSLGVNLFLGGFVLRGVLDPPRGPPPPSIDRVIDRMTGYLPEADAAILRAVFEARRAEVEAQERSGRALHKAVAQALRQDPFDPEALAAAFARMDAHMMALHGSMQAIIVEATTHMSPEGRRGLARFRP
ncbi:periplasmic heavy metal sensor [Roseospira visakhapatnamensis]|uniref:Putative membrane protein n=1 Tax=Roseospira visakhapatnamensis TaxID=390880 RepID=A0A7W6RA22_9PROT|nr:periplasmic heavy metal sensor [Roseospira visakhapatnamensis]MBB4264699.1 putative membrane protein [Roseospira visakhapatnamensis]